MGSVFQPFNLNGCPRQNFSLPYQYNVKLASDENKEKYHYMKELLFDPIPNSSNKYHKNCMADSKEN